MKTLFNPDRNCHYRLITPLDKGGFGSVYTGFTDQNVEVAIKLIRPTSNFEKDFDSWFTDQRIHLLCLEHPNIVIAFDQFISSDGELVLVMEKASASLDTLLKKVVRFNPILVCTVGIQLLSALAYLHSKKIIHRDVTLKNILFFNDGRFKLNDFGISKECMSDETLARTQIGLTCFYPPELLLWGFSNPQSDIYQLGIVLLTLLTGNYPIPLNTSVADARLMILDGLPRQKAENLLPVYGSLAQIISRMLRRRPSYRFQSAFEVKYEFLTEIKRWVNTN
jgi:serine/threonine-protein kinase